MFTKIQNKISQENEIRAFIFASTAIATWFIVTMTNGYLSGACHI